MDDADWSLVSKEEADFEVEMQMEFLRWLESPQVRLLHINHADGSNHAPPSMDFSKRLQIIGLCGLVWHLSVDRTHGSSGHPFSFKLRSVTPLIDHYHHHRNGDYIQGMPPDGSAAGSDNDADCMDTFDRLITPFVSTPATFRQIDSKSFLCSQSVESSTSLNEALDALLEFSAWYSRSFMHELSQEGWTPQDIQFENSIMQGLYDGVSVRREAQEAQQQCQSSKVALTEASQALAIMLMNAFNSELMPARRPSYVDEEPLTQAEWSKRFMCSHAIKHGDVLQWCTIEIYGPLISCNIDISEFLLEQAQQEAARCVGILANKPLMIKFDDEACLLGISQELNAEEDINHDVHKNDCNDHDDCCSYMEFTNLIRRPPTKLGTNIILKAIVESTISEYNHGSLSGNLFVNILQKVSWYLFHLSSICIVCADQKELSTLPRTCSKDICKMTFSDWQGIARLDLEELKLPTEIVDQIYPIV